MLSLLLFTFYTESVRLNAKNRRSAEGVTFVLSETKKNDRPHSDIEHISILIYLKINN